MSKAALQKVLAIMTDKKSPLGNAENYRLSLDAGSNELFVKESDILNQLRISLSLDINFDKLKESELNIIANTYYTGLIAQLQPFRTNTPGLFRANEATRNNYGVFAKALQAQNKIAFDKYVSIVGTTKVKEGFGSESGKSLTSGKLLQFDHRRTVSDTRYVDLLTRGPINLLGLLRDTAVVEKEDIDILYEIYSYYTSSGTKVFRSEVSVEGDIESGYTNEARGKDEVNKRSRRIAEGLKKLELKGAAYWAGQESSDSKIMQVNKILVGQMMKSIKKSKNITAKTDLRSLKPDTSSNSAKRQVKQQVTSKVNRSRIAGQASKKQVQQKASTSYLSLIPILNAKLPPVVRLNMVGDRLHNVTGTFSESVQVVDIQDTGKGFPSIAYTYQREPYDVFDPVIGAKPWNTPGRDPKALIDVSIRQIAQQLAIGRFYTRRA